MGVWRFGGLVLVAAVAVTAMLWWLGYWIIAFAVGVAVMAIGMTVYAATRAGSHRDRRSFTS